jgi:GNAT superfamily N-acetyltransferase
MGDLEAAHSVLSPLAVAPTYQSQGIGSRLLVAAPSAGDQIWHLVATLAEFDGADCATAQIPLITTSGMAARSSWH